MLRLNYTVYTYTLISKFKSVAGNDVSQLYSNGNLFYMLIQYLKCKSVLTLGLSCYTFIITYRLVYHGAPEQVIPKT